MKSEGKAYIVIGVFLIGFYAGQATNSPDLTNWKFIVELSSVLAGVGAIGTFYIAYNAMKNWKKSLTNSVCINSAVELEDKLTRFFLACLSKPDELKGNKDLLLYEDINLLSWRLRRRGFGVDELIVIEDLLKEVSDSLKNKGEIPQGLRERLYNAMNEFSQNF
ncbi:hypothetical protein J4H56_02015 [Vibrio alginolyticus]|uniref:hypothetical protein n=1 Tax=Vibrio harveyi group TaxID=717610 RepID=UPI000471DC76|nr:MULTISPECIES: hypothetical protein [Vibrio harveyi group]MBS9881363.1 hypothetical protein [Vibrio alginolyticus]